MTADIVDPQWPRVGDQDPEHPSATRKFSDRPVGLLVDAERDEALERLAVLVENADRRVPGAGQLPPGLEDALEHHVQLELRHERAADIQQ